MVPCRVLAGALLGHSMSHCMVDSACMMERRVTMTMNSFRRKGSLHRLDACRRGYGEVALVTSPLLCHGQVWRSSMASMSLHAALGAALSHNKAVKQSTGSLGGLQALLSCDVQVWRSRVALPHPGPNSNHKGFVGRSSYVGTMLAMARCGGAAWRA